MKIEKSGSIHILTFPAGNLEYDFTTVPPEHPQEHALLELYRLATEPRDVVLNFSQVTGINAFVLGLLVEGQEAISKADKHLAFCQMRPPVEAFVREYAPDFHHFRIYSAEEAAIYYMTHR